MKCQNCDELLNNSNLKAYILFPCCETICSQCISAQVGQGCIKCNEQVTSRLLKRKSNELTERLYEKCYQNKYKEICFLEAGNFGCVYIVQNIKNKKLYLKQ